MDRLFSLGGKVAIVTGGNGGIGKGIAEGLAEAGANLVIAARKPEKIEKAVDEIKAKFGVPVRGIAGDLTQENQIRRMVSQTLESFGRIDILVN
ncbi:MAG: SDR family NAD(P)-dependent oxidoreductase, partial [Desulfobacterales bacterium]